MFAMNPSFFLFIALHLCAGKVLGMTVTTKTQTLERAEGDTVEMSCAYVTDAENMQALDIEWLKVDALKPVVMYTDGVVFTPLEGQNSRYNFSGDYLNGDASITIRSTQMSDGGTYICKVKKHGDISSVEVKLTILVKPIPKCSLEGGQPKINENVKMKCTADIGTPEISYTWTRLSPIPTSPIRYTNVLGELWLKNVTLDDSGLYQCNASNRIGSNVCSTLLLVIPKEGKVLGMRVTTNTKTLEKFEGDAVQISCTYVTVPENMHFMDFEWLRFNALKPVVMYADGKVFTPLEGQTSRYNVSVDYLNGDVSIKIRSTQMSDNRMYICKVKKHGDISSVEVKLTLLESAISGSIVAVIIIDVMLLFPVLCFLALFIFLRCTNSKTGKKSTRNHPDDVRFCTQMCSF